MNAALQATTAPAGMHADEWGARVELAACYRVFAMLGWDRDDLQPHHAAPAAQRER
jgi:hypothetical protein